MTLVFCTECQRAYDATKSDLCPICFPSESVEMQLWAAAPRGAVIAEYQEGRPPIEYRWNQWARWDAQRIARLRRLRASSMPPRAVGTRQLSPDHDEEDDAREMRRSGRLTLKSRDLFLRLDRYLPHDIWWEILGYVKTSDLWSMALNQQLCRSIDLSVQARFNLNKSLSRSPTSLLSRIKIFDPEIDFENLCIQSLYLLPSYVLVGIKGFLKFSFQSPGRSGSNFLANRTHPYHVYSTGCAFAALLSDNSLICWGITTHGGIAPFIEPGLTVRAIYSTDWAFAALLSDNSLICWGITAYGGIAPFIEPGLTVRAIYSTGGAFAALLSDNSLICWGDATFGGAAPGLGPGLTVRAIYSTGCAFAALLSDNSLICWGDATRGGVAPGLGPGLTVRAIYSTDGAFAALLSDNSLICWGHATRGGVAPVIRPGLTVRAIYSTSWAFAALLSNNSLICWGCTAYGGIAPGLEPGLTVRAIYSTGCAFAALLSNGLLICWGEDALGGAFALPPGLTIKPIM